MPELTVDEVEAKKLGREFYGSKKYVQNLLNGMAEFVCISSKVI